LAGRRLSYHRSAACPPTLTKRPPTAAKRPPTLTQRPPTLTKRAARRDAGLTWVVALG